MMVNKIITAIVDIIGPMEFSAKQLNNIEKLAKAGDMHGRNKSGKAFLTVDEGAKLIMSAGLIQPEGQKKLATLAAEARKVA